MTRPVVASVVGQVSDTRWGQVLTTPHTYGVIEVFVPDGTARQRGIELLTKLTKLLGDPPASLAAMESIIDDVITNDVVSLTLLVPVGKELFISARGVGSVYLKRDTRLARLVDGAQSLSGEVQQGDTVIIASAGFVRSLTPSDITGVFDHLTPVEVAEKLTLLLHSADAGEGGAAVIFHIEPDPVVVATAPEVPKRQASRAAFLGKVKSLGKKYTSPSARNRLRTLATIVRKPSFFKSPKLIAGVVISLFVISVLLGFRHQTSTVQQGKTAEVIAQAQYAFDTGMQLLDLNPVKGREQLTHARDLLAPLVGKKNSGDTKKIKELYAAVTDNLTRAMHVVKETPELFFDAALVKPGASISDMSYFEGKFGLLDGRGKTVFSLDAANKNGIIVGGGESFANPTQVAAYGDKLYVLTDTGITAIRLSDKKAVPNVIPKAPEWGTIMDMEDFGGNLYLLDSTKSRIWKYVATEKGFTELREYLNPDAFPDLGRSVSMAIDGSVWLGTLDGKVNRFTTGKENTYAVQGLDTSLGRRVMAYVDDTAKSVYFLDSTNYRVVVFDKDGFYLGQYVWDNGMLPQGIAVSEELKKIFLLADGKIYAMVMK